jgi:hypothetical protein
VNHVLRELKESGNSELLHHSLLEELNLDIVAALGSSIQDTYCLIRRQLVFGMYRHLLKGTVHRFINRLKVVYN